MASTGTAGQRQPPLNDGGPLEAQKRAAAEAAAELIQEGMRVGLGTGSTVAHLLPAIAARGLGGLRCAATSPASATAARELGLEVVELDQLGGLDIAIDGADQVDPACWLIKGGGGAHVREKIVATAAHRFVVIVSADKPVAELAAPVPLELLAFGSGITLSSLAPAELRAGAPLSPDGGLIADYLGPIGDPAALAARLSATPGLVGHGLFEPGLVSDVLIGEPGGGVTHRSGPKPA
jgi:ribose 5-phosphate isomerase A